ncbi:hypothetical protein ACRAWC_22515 [Leifsonia sp. L25]|uniref:family 4 glycosyl hydrolase n=1 Tax=Leifsonia sp. L25 TaxID=3423957 RepID=UPI003D6938A3
MDVDGPRLEDRRRHGAPDAGPSGRRRPGHPHDRPHGGDRGADAVLIQLRVGGQKARLQDELFPLACGCVGQETTGAGGLAKALRTVPVVLDIAREARERANPDAWIVDFTNPVGINTRGAAGRRTQGDRAVQLRDRGAALDRPRARRGAAPCRGVPRRA